MQLINKNTDYAMRALLSLGRNGGRQITSREIAEEEHIPLQFVRRILQELVKHGYVETKEGVRGGARLKQKPDHIRLSDIITLFQGTIQLSSCMFRKKLCSNRVNCVIRKRLQNIEDKVVDEFNQVTLATLLDDIKNGACA